MLRIATAAFAAMFAGAAHARRQRAVSSAAMIWSALLTVGSVVVTEIVALPPPASLQPIEIPAPVRTRGMTSPWQGAAARASVAA